MKTSPSQVCLKKAKKTNERFCNGLVKGSASIQLKCCECLIQRAECVGVCVCACVFVCLAYFQCRIWPAGVLFISWSSSRVIRSNLQTSWFPVWLHVIFSKEIVIRILSIFTFCYLSYCTFSYYKKYSLLFISLKIHHDQQNVAFWTKKIWQKNGLL